MGRTAQAAGGDAAEARPGEPHRARAAPDLAARSLTELAGAIRGREDLVEGWREDLARYHRDERAELGKAHGERAREIERGWREFYRSRLVEAERRAWAVRETMREREQARERERGRTITRIVVPRPPPARGPERGGPGADEDGASRGGAPDALRPAFI